MKTNNILIRPFRIGDYEKVAALWEEAGIHYRPNGRENRARIAQEMKTGQAIFMVAAAGETIVGVVLGTHDGRKGWINRLAVAKEFRRQNIALKLVTSVENKLDELGIGVVACLIEPENTVSTTYTKAPVLYFSKKKSIDA